MGFNSGFKGLIRPSQLFTITVTLLVYGSFLFLFNNVIYVFYIVMAMYSYCMFMYDYPD